MTEKADSKVKIPSQKSVSHGGEDYTMQRLIPSQWIRLKERCKDRKTGTIDEELLINEILEHIIVAPRLRMDDLDWADLDKLIGKALDFQTGGRF